MKMTLDEHNKLGLAWIRIACVITQHANGWSPYQNQYVLCKQKSGEYGKVISQILHQIVAYITLKTNGFADAGFMLELCLNISYLHQR